MANDIRMTPEQFCYWLNGRAEVCRHVPTEEEWTCIKEHLALVFTKVTPPGPGTLIPLHQVPNHYCLPSDIRNYPQTIC